EDPFAEFAVQGASAEQDHKADEKGRHKTHTPFPGLHGRPNFYILPYQIFGRSAVKKRKLTARALTEEGPWASRIR
ncbi:MAG: hypothetical protein PUD38_02825, partial [Firmicutes bacterium]|nr:hypothetical protein [Bacillota bacterium]